MMELVGLLMVDAVVMMAKAAGMMKAADRRDGVTMFLQRFQ